MEGKLGLAATNAIIAYKEGNCPHEIRSHPDCPNNEAWHFVKATHLSTIEMLNMLAD